MTVNIKIINDKMSENRDESPEGSPRSRICRFFCPTKPKKEKDKSRDRTKNEASQTQDKPAEKKKEEDKPDELPVKDIRKSIETELDPNKLTTLINNSIKEAVRSIVKDGVCDFIENPPSIPKKPKDKPKKKPPESPEDLIPTKDSNKEKSLLTSEEKRTFDSHSKSPRSPRSPRPPKALTPPKSPERPAVSQCDRSICPAYAAVDCSKRSKHKKPKPKQNVSTDNRRMTGNVNIYICSEANENAKRKSPEKDKCSEESVSESEMNSSPSASSVSTSKLVDALKKKRRKIMEAQELECLCEEPEDAVATEKSTKRMSEAPDEMSSFSRLNYSNDNVSSEDYLDGCSLENCPALSSNDFDRYSAYGNDDSWDPRRNSTRNYSFLPAERDVPVRDTFGEDVCCPCEQAKSSRAPCVCGSQQKVHSVATNYPENGLVRCDEQAKEVEDNQCCGTKNEPEGFTVCTNEPVEFTVCGPPETTVEETVEKTSPIELSNESLKEEELPTEREDSTQKKESDASEVLPTEPTDSGDKKRESFLLRSWRRAMTIVKRPRTSGPEADDSEKSKLSQEPKESENSELKMKDQQPLKVEPKSNSSSTLSQSSRNRRGKSKILAKISDKQKQKRGSHSDSKLSDSSIQKPEAVPSPESLEKPREEDKPEVDCECTPEEPKIVPCTFIQAEEPQPEECCPSCNKKKMSCVCCQTCCRPQEAGECRCHEPQRETKCCTCQQETSCCTCRQPVFKAPKPRKMACGSCCNPINCCTCRAPVRKCSYCGMPSDFCNCQPPCAKGRSMPDQNNNNGIRGNWKPRPGIPSRFPRDRLNRENPDNCHCDQSKPYGSEELPYQKLNVFSNVMTELQQKISDSVNCDKCNNTSCCCPKTARCLNTIAERPSSPNRNDSALDCKCPRTKRKTTTFAVCDNCRTSPCRCRRDKRPQAKCFYCKTMPCRCNWKYEQTRPQFDEDFGKRKPRGCRCPSPNRMTKGKDFMPQRHRPHKNWID